MDVVPLLSDERFRVRAFVTEMVVTPKGPRSERSYGAIYDSRAPKDLVDAANPERLKEFWRADGRILREGQAAAEEIGDVLSFLSTNLALDSSKPAFAKAFPKIDELEAAGRIDCRGMPCSQVRVVRDQGSRLWVTATNPFGTYGAIVASLDENSAKSSVNVFGLVFGL